MWGWKRWLGCHQTPPVLTLLLPGTEASLSSFRWGSEDGPGQLLEGRRGRAQDTQLQCPLAMSNGGPGTQEPPAERGGERVL